MLLNAVISLKLRVIIDEYLSSLQIKDKKYEIYYFSGQ
jgi:hypothetical protein